MVVIGALRVIYHFIQIRWSIDETKISFIYSKGLASGFFIVPGVLLAYRLFEAAIVISIMLIILGVIVDKKIEP